MSALEVVGLLACVVVAFLAGLFIRFGRAYFQEKGENLATKEDTASITREVERVRLEYGEKLEEVLQQNRALLEEGRRRHELRLAALDRRLEVHQEAYSLWWRMIPHVHEKETDKRLRFAGECEAWFIAHRLYLEPQVADAFSRAYDAVRSHRDILQGPKPLDTELLDRSWKSVVGLGEVIVRAVQLPELNEVERRLVERVGKEGPSGQ